MPDCTLNPTDPVCQAFYGSDRLSTLQRALSKNLFTFASTTGGGIATDAGQTPVGPGTIVTTAGAGSTIGAVWTAIPTPIKLIGAAALAFLGYRALKPKARSAGISGARRRR